MRHAHAHNDTPVKSTAQGYLDGLRPYRSRAPWFGGDLQTVRNSFFPVRPEQADESLYLEMSDASGDRLLVRHFRGAPEKPLIVLMHGLAGDEGSSYMILALRHLRRIGFPVLLVNLRGALPSRPTCKLQYHAGRSEDLRDLLIALPDGMIEAGAVMVGFSLAGNMVLKFAAEFAASLPVAGVVAVSAPVDLALTSANMLRARNYLYNQRLLADYKKQCTAAGAHVSEEENAAIRRSRNFVDFDNFFVAPRNGFRDAEDYWQKSQAKQFLGAIPVPSLIIHAIDDPMVPFAVYDGVDWRSNTKLVPCFTKGGGHVGFHAPDGPWYAPAIGRFSDQL